MPSAWGSRTCMADQSRTQKTLKEMVEESPFWNAEDLIRNLDAELDRIEHGIGHMVWDDSNRPVTICLRLLPITPRFRVKESEGKFSIEVDLPNVSEDLVSVKVDKAGVEVSACTPDPVWRPCYVTSGRVAPMDACT